MAYFWISPPANFIAASDTSSILADKVAASLFVVLDMGRNSWEGGGTEERGLLSVGVFVAPEYVVLLEVVDVGLLGVVEGLLNGA